MKKILLILSLVAVAGSACRKYPIDENGLLITDNNICSMSSFNLVGTDNQTVLITQPTLGNGLVDTVNLKVTAVARFGTNMLKVKPYCGIGADVTVSPKMGEFTDFTQPRTYTLTSGNRQIKKVYTITVTVQQ